MTLRISLLSNDFFGVDDLNDFLGLEEWPRVEGEARRFRKIINQLVFEFVDKQYVRGRKKCEFYGQQNFFLLSSPSPIVESGFPGSSRDSVLIFTALEECYCDFSLR